MALLLQIDKSTETDVIPVTEDGGAGAGEAGITADDTAGVSESADGSVPQAGNEADQPGEVQLVPDAADTYSKAAENLRQSATELLPDSLTEVGSDFSEYKIWGLSAWELILGFIVILIAVGVRKLVIRIIDNYLKPLAARTETKYDDRMLGALRRAVSYFVLLAGFFVAFSIIQLPASPLDLQAAVWRVLNTMFIVLGGLLIYRIIEISLMFMAEVRSESGQGMLDNQLVPLIRDVCKIAVIVLVVITVVQSWGYSATGLLAGVGIGGLALAFAAQDTVANVFGSFVIYSDRPYKVGDWIDFNGVEGTVEEIGIRSTRIRKFDKTVVSVPNKAVTSENIQNYSEMTLRRIKVFLGLSYQTPTADVDAVVADIRQLISAHEGIDQNFWIVNFTEMNAYSLDVLIYCFTKTTVWTEYMDIRQEILLKIIDICSKYDVEIAFPTQTIFYKNGDESAAGGLPSKLGRRPSGDMPAEFSKQDSGRLASPESGDLQSQRGEFDTNADGDS